MIHSRPAICPSAPIPMANPSMNSDPVETAVKDIEVLEVVLGYGWIRDDMGMELSNLCWMYWYIGASRVFIDFF